MGSHITITAITALNLWKILAVAPAGTTCRQINGQIWGSLL